MLLLVMMAYDRYVAIRKPLHYSSIMNTKMCIRRVMTSWIIGFVHSISQLAIITQLPFCGPRKLDSFFCDIPLVIKLVCMDTYILEVLTNANSGVLATICFILLLISYSYILLTVCHQSKGAASKALSTCTAHITVVMLFFGPCIFVYICPLSITWVDKFLAVFYAIITPLLNPVIYTLRNKEIRNAIKRLWWQTVDFFGISSFQIMRISTVSALNWPHLPCYLRLGRVPQFTYGNHVYLLIKILCQVFRILGLLK